MPELPEVETTVRELNKLILKKKIKGLWSDFKKIVKRPNFEKFQKEIKGKRIEKIWRRAKNIIFELSGGKFLLIHQKLTGHLLVGKWNFQKNKWIAQEPGPLQEKVNSFIHLIFFLEGGLMLALSDLRKFAKVELLEKKEIENLEKNLGPEPLEKDFSFQKFKEIFKQKRGKIKEILMDQKTIAGIGNIYSDEILFKAKIHPQKELKDIKENDLKRIYFSMKEILKKAIILGGESISDYRKPDGKKGNFDKIRRVYRRENQPCFLCKSKIKRIKIGGRSSYFCPHCQK